MGLGHRMAEVFFGYAFAKQLQMKTSVPSHLSAVSTEHGEAYAWFWNRVYIPNLHSETSLQHNHRMRYARVSDISTERFAENDTIYHMGYGDCRGDCFDMGPCVLQSVRDEIKFNRTFHEFGPDEFHVVWNIRTGAGHSPSYPPIYYKKVVSYVCKLAGFYQMSKKVVHISTRDYRRTHHVAAYFAEQCPHLHVREEVSWSTEYTFLGMVNANLLITSGGSFSEMASYLSRNPALGSLSRMFWLWKLEHQVKSNYQYFSMMENVIKLDVRGEIIYCAEENAKLCNLLKN